MRGSATGRSRLTTTSALRLVPAHTGHTRSGARPPASAWYKLEVAKRRLVFTLLALRLPISNRRRSGHGLAFEFQADPIRGAPVLTGHSDGIITINMAEADDAERERRRPAVHEPYRTLLGHIRHESGHYYWDRLIGERRNRAFRAIFGDERVDYADACGPLRAGPPADWQTVRDEYASAHAWEDWAETWAHYLHMVDTVETAAACGLSLRPRRRDEPTLPVPEPASSSQCRSTGCSTAGSRSPTC